MAQLSATILKQATFSLQPLSSTSIFAHGLLCLLTTEHHARPFVSVERLLAIRPGNSSAGFSALACLSSAAVTWQYMHPSWICMLPHRLPSLPKKRVCAGKSVCASVARDELRLLNWFSSEGWHNTREATKRLVIPPLAVVVVGEVHFGTTWHLLLDVQRTHTIFFNFFANV